MADTKITALAAIATVDPAADVLPIVDISDTSMAASGTTKKVTTNQILQAGGTATLASATITGNLTVQSNVNAPANVSFRYGPSAATWAGLRFDGTNQTFLDSDIGISFRTGGATSFTTAYQIGATGISTWSVAGTTAMTLNATGLGLGVVPSAWSASFKSVQVGSRLVLTTTGSDTFFGNNFYNDGAYKFINSDFATYYDQTTGKHVWGTSTTSGTAGGVITWNPAMTLTAAGNLAVGVAATGNRLDLQNSTDCTVLVKSTGANANVSLDYVSSYGNNTIRKSGTTVWDFGVINDSSATPAFKVSNASSVGVQLVSGATSWTTLSDETMKDIIEPISNAVAKVGSLRSVIGKFKTDDASKRRSFLIAQDVQSVLPEAVDVIGENNELGLRYTEVIPLLVAAIKELTAEVNALKKA